MHRMLAYIPSLSSSSLYMCSVNHQPPRSIPFPFLSVSTALAFNSSFNAPSALLVILLLRFPIPSFDELPLVHGSHDFRLASPNGDGVPMVSENSVDAVDSFLIIVGFDSIDESSEGLVVIGKVVLGVSRGRLVCGAAG